MITRREFMKISAVSGAGAAFGASAAEPAFRACIIGHTGRGDYGHGLDVALTDVPGVEVLAVADPDETGRIKAVERAKAKRGYPDWREMLEKEKPNLVCLAPRWSEHRHEMAIAALNGGAHIYSEKPSTRTLAEADEILALAKRKNLKIAVAHQIRLSPTTLKLKEALGSGLIGDLVQIQSWGKQDNRAGGEDMLVLGSHLFDLLRFFGGDPQSCSARVLQDGHEITRQSGRTVTEQIGPVAGNSIHAQFAFNNGLTATYTSDNKLRETLGPWSIRFLGSKGSVHLLVEIDPRVYLSKPGNWSAEGRSDEWVRWPDDPKSSGSFPNANQRVVDDLLAAIKEDREPVCSASAATKSLEMIMAVYESAITKRAIGFPLERRTHPLTTS